MPRQRNSENGFREFPRKLAIGSASTGPFLKEVKERSGAVNFVSRQYTHEGTGSSVDLWLIIGHARDIIRHTPDICYPSSGFQQRGSRLRHTVYYEPGKEGRFYTSKFQKEDALVRQTQRVFWAWNHPEFHKWDAPESPRFFYGMATRALYKMYFTSTVSPSEDTLDDNAAAEFAELVLPVIDEALFGDIPMTGSDSGNASPESGEQNSEPDADVSEPVVESTPTE